MHSENASITDGKEQRITLNRKVFVGLSSTQDRQENLVILINQSVGFAAIHCRKSSK